jgi:glycosyltransferase involved in cell wall biosynthesis
MKNVKRLIMLNQMAGPLFCELAEGISSQFEDGVILHTGHPDAEKTINSEKILLLKAPELNRKSKFTRALSWLWYLFSTTKLILFAKKGDEFLLTSNPPLLGIWFWLMNFIKNKPFIILVYDIHPDVLVEMGIFSQSNIIVKVWNWINKKFYRNSNSIVTLGKYMASRLSTSNNLPLEKINVIPPWVDTEIIRPLNYESNPLAGKFNPKRKSIVLYSGNMGFSHDIETILGASKQLRNRKDILFLFVGGGHKFQIVKDFQVKNNLKNIAIYPYQDEKDIPYTMTLASISLVALGGNAHQLMLPSKVFYYMAAGSAVIGICSSQSELNEIIISNNCGYCVEPGDYLKLANVIEKLLQNTEELDSCRYNSRRFATEIGSKEKGINQFISLLKRS